MIRPYGRRPRYGDAVTSEANRGLTHAPPSTANPLERFVGFVVDQTLDLGRRLGLGTVPPTVVLVGSALAIGGAYYVITRR